MLEHCPAGADVLVSQPDPNSTNPGDTIERDVRVVDTSESMTDNVVYLDIDR